MAKPEIRLKGFEGEWKTTQLDTCVDFLDNMRKPVKEGYRIKGIYPYYGASGIVDYIDDYIFDEELILLSEDGANITDRNYPVCFLAAGKYWVNNHAHVLKAKYGFINSFLCNALERKDYTQYNTGMAMPKLNKEVCKGIPLALPSVEEQSAIADYFKSLDSLLQSTTKKIESLKQVKQACLASMFPKADETTPRVRFKGFEGKWECIKFGSIITECFDKTTSEDEDVLLSSAIDGLYLNSELFSHFRGQSNIGYRKVKKNMLILSAQNLHLGNANVNLRFEHGIVSPAYKIYYIHDCNAELLSHWIKREETKDFFLNATTSGASVCRKNIVWEDLYKQKLFIPKEDKEQRMIASFFTSLDKQISLQEKRLEKLKHIKLACLDKMFV